MVSSPFSLAQAAFSIPFRVTVFFTRCWITVVFLYLRWTQAIMKWSARTIKRVIRRSLKLQLELLSLIVVTFLSIITGSSRDGEAAEKEAKTEYRRVKIIARPRSAGLSSGQTGGGDTRAAGEHDLSTKFGSNFEDQSQLGDPSALIREFKSRTIIQDLEELVNSDTKDEVEQENEEARAQTNLQDPPQLERPSYNGECAADVNVKLKPEQEDKEESSELECSTVYSPAVLAISNLRASLQQVEIVTESALSSDATLQQDAHTEDEQGCYSSEHQEAASVEGGRNGIVVKNPTGIEPNTDIVQPPSVCDELSESGSETVATPPGEFVVADDTAQHRDVLGEKAPIAEEASVTVHQLLLRLEEEISQLSPIREVPETFDATEPRSLDTAKDLADTQSNHDDESQLERSPPMFLRSMPTIDVEAVTSTTGPLLEPVPLATLNPEEERELSESAPSSPALSLHEVSPLPRSRRLSVYEPEMLDADGNNAEFYKEAVNLARELDMRIGLLVVSLITERESASRNWTSESPYSLADGPSNTVLMKIAGLVEKALGQKLYDEFANESEKIESMLQDAWQAWSVFCMKLAMEPLLFGFYLRSKGEIAAILQLLSAEEPEPYQLWLSVSNPSWCSPYTEQSLIGSAEDISILSKDNKNIETYCLLEDVHHILRENGANTSEFKSKLHKFDRRLPSFRSAIEQTREVLLLGLLEVFEVAGESQIVLAIDRARLRETCTAVIHSALALVDHLRSRQGQVDVELFSIEPGTRFNKGLMDTEEGESGIVSCTICPGLREAGARRRILLKPMVVLA